MELMMLTPLKDGRQISRNTSENVARQNAAHGNSVKVACPNMESMPAENLESRFSNTVSRQRSGRISPPLPPPAFCSKPPSRDEAVPPRPSNAASGARSVPRLPHTQPLLSPRAQESAKSQWASKLAPVMETPVPSRASFRPPMRSPQSASRDIMGSRSSTPGPSFRTTLGGMTNVVQQQQQQQLQQQQLNHNSMRSRSYQPPRPLQTSPSQGRGGVPRINAPAGLPQAPPVPPPPPSRAATPGRAAPAIGGMSTPQPRSPQQMPCRLGGPQWGRTASPLRGACQMAAACSKSSDKRELMIAATEVEEEAGSGIVAPRTLSRLSCASSSASEATGWRPRRGNAQNCCC